MQVKRVARREPPAASSRAVAALLAVLFVSLAPGSAGAQFTSDATRMVDVEGQPTRVLTLGLDHRGEGQPVLVLQAGAGSRMENWRGWVLSVAELAPVVAYDRVGIGGSPFDGVDPTFDRVLTHLHDLLGVLDVPPPYILVGHSWGGPLNLFYADRHPDDVVGLVYLDPTPPRMAPQEWWAASSDAEFESRMLEYEAMLAAENPPPGAAAETRFIDSFLFAPVESRDVPMDPDVPTALMMGTKAEPVQDGALSFEDEWGPNMTRIRLDRIPKWLGTIPQGTLIVASDAGHFVHWDDPELALQAVRRVIDQTRRQRDGAGGGEA